MAKEVNKPKWQVEITFSKIIIQPKPTETIKKFFLLKSLYFKRQEELELMQGKNVPSTRDQKTTGRAYADLIKGQTEYGLPHKGRFIVKKISDDKVIIKQIA